MAYDLSNLNAYTSAHGKVFEVCSVLGADCGEGMQARAWRVAGNALCMPCAAVCHVVLLSECCKGAVARELFC